MEPRIGVFVCHCGTNIAGVVDVRRVAEAAAAWPDVVYATEYKFMCSDPGQGMVKDAIVKHNLTRVVVAACSPRMHEPTFRKACAMAGLNPYLFEMANIREHCSWVHEDKEAATLKAIDIVRTSVAKARLLEPLQARVVSVTPKVLVVGGGVAGIQAALDIANAGTKVVLVERSQSIAASMSQLSREHPMRVDVGPALIPAPTSTIASPRRRRPCNRAGMTRESLNTSTSPDLRKSGKSAIRPS